MPLWGACDLAILLESHKQFKQALGPENFIPSELIDTGYPTKNIVVETHVTDRAIRSKLPRQISILIMNCDTHKANSIILEKVLPQLTKGATIIVRGYTPSIEERNGAIRLLHKHAPDLVLTPVTDDCWAATV